MLVYLDLVVLLNFLVDFLLLVGTNRLCGFPAQCGRCALSAVAGSLYAAACMLPDLRFLGSMLWRIVFLSLMGACAFGLSKSALRRTLLFTLLSMALGGAAMGFGGGGFFSLAAGAALLLAVCIWGFRYHPGSRSYVPVELSYGQRKQKLMALCDTGNTLTDPITGGSVLIISAEAACALVGLSKQQLCSPVETLASGVVPGMRLIPYQAVGQSCGMLLAMRFDNVLIGSRRGSTLVAFAPSGLDKEGGYQALTGGIV